MVGLPSCPLRERSPSLLLPLLAILTAWSGCRRASPALPILGELPSFSLTSHHGEPVSRTTLAQQLWVADFIFTRCGGICPVMTARLARLRDEVPASVAFVSFTVDPEHDTPEVLSAYAKDAGASGNWLFLTGSREALYALSTGGFKLVALEVPPQERVAGGDGPFLHSSKLVLVDDNGRLRGYYDSSDDVAVKRLVADIDALGREVAR